MAEPFPARRDAHYTAGQLALRRGDRVLYRFGGDLGFVTGAVREAPRWWGCAWVVWLDQRTAPLPLRDVFPTAVPAQAARYHVHDYQI